MSQDTEWKVLGEVLDSFVVGFGVQAGETGGGKRGEESIDSMAVNPSTCLVVS